MKVTVSNSVVRTVHTAPLLYCHEMVMCGGTAVLVVSQYQKYRITPRYWYHNKIVQHCHINTVVPSDTIVVHNTACSSSDSLPSYP